MKRKLKPRWNRIFVALLILSIFIYGCISICEDVSNLFKTNNNVEVNVSEAMVVENGSEVAKANTEVSNNNVVTKPTTTVVAKENYTRKENYRLTSYHQQDGSSGSCTGSGKCVSDFQINNKGWYTYEGKLVLAGATKECLNSKSGACGNWNTPVSGRKYFKYYDTVSLTIDGIKYEGIILDSCGASMSVKENRIDLFVSNSSSTIDRGYKGHNMIEVSWEENNG